MTAESTTVSLANTSPFATFSGIATDRGEALIEEEIVSYVVGTGELTLTRGVLNTVALHILKVQVFKHMKLVEYHLLV